MTDIFDLVEASEPGDVPSLRELRVSGEPAAVLLFTGDGDTAGLHWEPSEDYGGYVACPGAHCPLCFMGSAPVRCVLLPVYSLDTKAVEVLRIPLRKTVGSAATVVPPLLKRPDIASTLVLLSRRGNDFRVETRPLPAIDAGGTRAIESYARSRDAGLSLVTIFPQPTASELAEIPRVRLKLDALGGYGTSETATP